MEYHKDSWTKYEYDRTREKDVVDTSNPGRIISGGDLHMDVDHMVKMNILLKTVLPQVIAVIIKKGGILPIFVKGSIRILR